MLVSDAQLKAFLVDRGIVDVDTLSALEEQAEHRSDTSIEDLLLEEDLLDEQRLTELKAYIRGVPVADISQQEIDPAVLRFIPEELARKRQVVPFAKKGSTLEVAMTDPDDLQTIEVVKKKTGLQVRPRLIAASNLQRALGLYQKSLSAEVGELMGAAKEDDNEGLASAITVSPNVLQEEDQQDLEKVAEEVPIIRIVDTVVHHATLQEASDIHVEPSEKEVVVRYRVDGILHDAMVLPRQVHAGVIARIKVLANLKLDEHRLPQDGRFKMERDGQKISFRVSVLPTFYGEKVVMRLLREDVKGLTLEELGLEGTALERVHRNIQRPHGMVLVTGPTGSGKTTTLYTILDILNTPEVNISTVEDPIEYQIPRVNQTQVQPDIGLTFASGLRSLVRQDPDIIMVGEIRDTETAQLAVNAALTGHLVLSTLHTNSAAGALPRLIDMGIEPYLIASTVNLIVAQRLVRRLCSDAEKQSLTNSQRSELFALIDEDRVLAELRADGVIRKKDNWETLSFYTPTETDECSDGYKGRIGIFEVMEVNERLQQLFTKKTTSDEIGDLARSEGMRLMLEDGIVKAIHGVTTLEEVLRVTKD